MAVTAETLIEELDNVRALLDKNSHDLVLLRREEALLERVSQLDEEE